MIACLASLGHPSPEFGFASCGARLRFGDKAIGDKLLPAIPERLAHVFGEVNLGHLRPSSRLTKFLRRKPNRQTPRTSGLGQELASLRHDKTV